VVDCGTGQQASEGQDVERRTIAPADVWDSTPHGFAQAVATTGGTTVHVSGQVAWDLDRRVPGDDLGAQARGALANLDRVLRAAGGTLADAVALRLYLVAERGEDLTGVGEALRAAFPGPLPATTWILVRGLATPDLRVEVEATAVLGGSDA
jgi:enamine deaminase RidA (YjgF/YER057c/UK114 family)